MSENINPPQVAGTFTASTGVAAISASNSTFDSTVRITGGPNVTVGTDASGVSISGAAAGVATAIQGISASDTVYTSGTVKITGSNMVTVKSGTGQAVVLDATQSVQPVGSLGLGSNTTGTTASLPFASNIQLRGGPNITLSQSSGTNSSIVAISGGAGGAGGGVAAAATGNTAGTMGTITSGTVGIAGGNAITISQSSGTASTNLSIVGPNTTTQSSETGSLSLSGNTSGTMANLPFYGNVLLAGGNNITLSQASGASSTRVTISGPSAAGAQTAISGISASDTLYTSGTVKVTGSNMVTVKSGTGQAVVIDATQSVQPAQTGISSIAASNTTYTSGQVEFTGSNAASVKSSANQRVVIDVPTQTAETGSLGPAGNTTGTTASLPFNANIQLAAGNNLTLSQSSGASSTRMTLSAASQSVQTQAIQSIAASNTTYTSGQVEFTGSNQATVKSSANQRVVVNVTTAAQTAQTQSNIQGIAGTNTTYNTGTVEFTGSNMVTVKSSANQRFVIDATQSVQPVGSLAATGNTTGTMGTLPLSGSIGIAGGNNITISQSSGTASTNLTISGAAAGGAQTAISSIGASNTTYTSGEVNFTGSNIVTVKSSAGQRVVIDASTSQSVQPGVQNLVASDNTFSSGTVSITGTGGGVTINTAASKIQVSVAAPVAQTAETGSLSLSGNTAGTMANLAFSNNVLLAGGNNITLSQSSGASSSRITISAASQSAQTGISSIAASNTTYTSGQAEFTGSNMVTVKSSANQRVVIDATQSVQPVGSLDLAGNTAGTMATLPFASNIEIAGGPNITVSQASGASSSRISISGGAGGGAGSAAAAGNTTGTMATLPLTGSIGLAGGPNVTISQSTGAASTNLSISGAPSPGSIAATGNTSGTMATLPLSGSVGLSGGNNVTISQSSGATSTNFVFSIPNTTFETQWNIGAFTNMDPNDVSVISHASAFSKTPFYYPVIIPGNLTMKSVGLRISHVNTSTLQSFSAHLGIYTRVNSTSAALLGSASDAFVYSTASSVSFSGMRDLVLTSPSTQTAISTLSAGAYIIGMMFSAAATGSMNWSLGGMTQSTAGVNLGNILPGTNSFNTATSQGLNVFLGQGSTTVNAMPANVSAPDLRNQGTATVPMLPFVFVRS